MQLLYLLSSCLLIAVLNSGCSPQTWYKQGATQADFDKDCAECQLLARELTSQQTISGKAKNYELLVKNYNNCIFARGWSSQPHQKNINNDFAHFKNQKIYTFDKCLEIPSEFILLSQNKSQFGNIYIQNFNFSSITGDFLKIDIQKSHELNFEDIPYPVSEPFKLFYRHQRTAIFFGKIKKQWIVGGGNFCLLDTNKRLVITLTQPLPDQKSTPQWPLNLSKNQYDKIKLFEKKWTSWLNNPLNLKPL